MTDMTFLKHKTTVQELKKVDKINLMTLLTRIILLKRLFNKPNKETKLPQKGLPNFFISLEVLEVKMVVLLYRESRHFEPNFLQYGASALLQTDNFSVGAIKKIVKKC